MRFKFTKVATVVAAMCMLGAVGVSSASAALPELVNKNGTELEYGFFAESSSTPVVFESSTSGSGNELVTTCKASTALGMVTGTKTSRLAITYSECKGPAEKEKEVGAGKCTSPGQPEGTVRTRPLLGKLVYLNKAHTTVGWQLEPATKNGMFMEMTCLSKLFHFTIGVHEAGKGGLDALLAEFKAPYKVKHTELTPVLECAAPGKQHWTSYWEGETSMASFLEDEYSFLEKGEPWEDICARSAGAPLHFEEEVELRA